MKKKIIVPILSSALLVAGGAAIIGTNWKYFKPMFKQQAIYLQADMDANFNKGYDAGNQVFNGTYLEQIASLNATISAKQAVISSLEQDIEENNNEIANLNTNLSIQNARVNELESEITSLEAQLNESNSNYATINSQLQTKISELEQANETLWNWKNQISELEQANQQKQATIDSLNAQVEDLNSEVARLTNELLEANNQISSLQQQISEKNALIESLNQQITSLNNQQNVDAQTISSLNAQIATLNAQIEELQAELRQYTGVPVTFMASGEQFGDVQHINEGDSVVVPANPTREGYIFEGWSANGTDVVDVSSYPITTAVTFTALFSRKEWQNTTVSCSELTQGRRVWYYNNETYCDEYKLNPTNKTWSYATYGISDGRYTFVLGSKVYHFSGNRQYDCYDFEAKKATSGTWDNLPADANANDVWVWKGKAYLSQGSYGQFEFDETTGGWVETTFNLNIWGENIWDDGETLYHGDNHKLDESTGNFISCTWNISGLKSTTVFKYNGDTYFSDGSSIENATPYKLNKTTNTWVVENWVNFPSKTTLAISLYAQGYDFWTDGTDLYYSVNKSGETLHFVNAKVVSA